MEPLLDRLGRPLETLRISITDRCNFRCVYCMPKEVFGREYAFLDRKELLSLEEIARVVSGHPAFVPCESPAASLWFVATSRSSSSCSRRSGVRRKPAEPR
jgi:hypothetical protein